MGGVIGQKDSTTAGLPSRPLSARRWEALAGRQSWPHHGLLRPRSVLLFSEIQSDSQLCGQKRGFEGRRLEISRSSVPKLFLSFSPIRNPNRALISRKKMKTKRLRSNIWVHCANVPAACLPTTSRLLFFHPKAHSVHSTSGQLVH
jgi:hypothetical protein